MYHGLKYYKYAEECSRKSIDIADDKDIKDMVLKMNGYILLGVTTRDMGLALNRAAYYFVMARNIAMDLLKDRKYEGMTRGHWGDYFLHLGDHTQAYMCYVKHRDLAASIQDKEGEAKAHASLGKLMLDMRKWQAAIQHFEKKSEIAW